jgi:hypothetical protein
VPEHVNNFSPLSLALEKDCFPIVNMSNPGEGTGHIQVAAGGGPGLTHSFSWARYHMVRIMDPCPQPNLHTF